MTHKKATAILDRSDDLASLTEAVAFLVEDSATKPEELLVALNLPGIVAEHAAIALHKMTDTPWDKDGQPVISHRFWNLRLKSDETIRLFKRIDPENRQILVNVIVEVDKAGGAPEPVTVTGKTLRRKRGRASGTGKKRDYAARRKHHNIDK